MRNIMEQEKLQKTLEALAKSGITVAGDLVLEKNVEYEVNNVEKGGIGIQIINGSKELPMMNSDKENESALGKLEEANDEEDVLPLTDADMAAACEQTLAECLWWADASWGTAYQIFLQKGYNGGIDQFVRDVKKWPFKKIFKKKCNKYSVGNPARKGTITWPFEKWREKGVAERQIILGKRLLEILKDKGKKVNMGI